MQLDSLFITVNIALCLEIVVNVIF